MMDIIANPPSVNSCVFGTGPVTVQLNDWARRLQPTRFYEA